jgi:hypothetical protein
MPQKRYRPEEIIAKLRQADVLLGEGKKVPEVIKALGITVRWELLHRFHRVQGCGVGPKRSCAPAFSFTACGHLGAIWAPRDA